MIITVLAFILTLGVLIVIHEYGHYRVAVACGVKVDRFSIGFGRVLWRRQPTPGGTEFVVSALPLGGYVRWIDDREGGVLPHEQNQTFRSKSLEHLIEGRPVILIHNGHVNRAAMRQTQMTMHELESALRASGCCGPDDVRFAVLENNGEVTVVRREKHKSGAEPTLPLAPA